MKRFLLPMILTAASWSALALYPPWQWVARVDGVDVIRHAGHGFVTSPPNVPMESQEDLSTTKMIPIYSGPRPPMPDGAPGNPFLIDESEMDEWTREVASLIIGHREEVTEKYGPWTFSGVPTDQWATVIDYQGVSLLGVSSLFASLCLGLVLVGLKRSH